MKKILITSLLTAGLAVSAMAEVNLKACAGCHGGDWSKKALGKSKVVANMTTKDIVDSIIGYKNGSYGGSMKGVMKSQVAKYSDEELKLVAESIKSNGKVIPSTDISIDSKGFVVDLSEGIASKGKKLYIKKMKKACEISGAKMAGKHTQDEWQTIGDSGTFDSEIKTICPNINSDKIKDKYKSHLLNFFYEFGADSGIVLSC